MTLWQRLSRFFRNYIPEPERPASEDAYFEVYFFEAGISVYQNPDTQEPRPVHRSYAANMFIRGLDMTEMLFDHEKGERERPFGVEFLEAFFDKHQLILKSSLPKWISDSECRLVLSKNCRNTLEIAKTSFSIIDFNVNPKVSGISSKKPKLVIASANPLARLKKLIDWHTGAENGYSYDDITILTLTTIDKSLLKDTSSLFGIPISQEKKVGSVLFTTAKKFKGLESKVVIIIDVDEQSFSNEETKRVFYVACSRAMHRLSIFIEGDEERIKSIAATISGPKFAPIGKIKNKTLTETFDGE